LQQAVGSKRLKAKENAKFIARHLSPEGIRGLNAFVFPDN